MTEQDRKKIAVLERALLIAAQLLSSEGYEANYSGDPENIVRFLRTWPAGS